MAGTLVPSHGRSENAKRALLQGVGVFKQRQVARRRAISQTGGNRCAGAKSLQSSMRRGGNCPNVSNYLSQKG